MDLTMTVYVLAAFTIAGTILLPIVGVGISLMRAGTPPDVDSGPSSEPGSD